MGGRIRVKCDFGQVMPKVSQQRLTITQRALNDQMKSDFHQFVPYKDSGLSGSVTSDADGKYIFYTTLYAKAQYYGQRTTKSGKVVKFRSYTTDGTGKRWDLKAKKLYIGSWERIIVKGLLK